MTPALDPQLELLGSPPDSVGRFTMREGPSGRIVAAPQRFFSPSPPRGVAFAHALGCKYRPAPTPLALRGYYSLHESRKKGDRTMSNHAHTDTTDATNTLDKAASAHSSPQERW